MASQTTSCGSVTTESNKGMTDPWTNPGNVTADGGGAATVSLASESDYLIAHNFGATIPAGATIDGVEYTTDIWTSASGTQSVFAYATIGTTATSTVGVNFIPFASSYAIQLSEAAWTVGGPSNLGGATWTASQINDSSSGFIFNCSKNTAPGTPVVSVDNIRRTVYYTVSPPVADFSATPLIGASPLSVTFTDTSTNTPTSWLWEKSDDAGASWSNFSSGATSQNPTEEFTAGAWSIRLTSTNAGGSDSETKLSYIAVSSSSRSTCVMISIEEAKRLGLI